jgi:hypothetical protein
MHSACTVYYDTVVTFQRGFAVRSASHEEEQEGMGGEDTGPNPDELARRIEALEREYRELRDALINGAPTNSSKWRDRCIVRDGARAVARSEERTGLLSPLSGGMALLRGRLAVDARRRVVRSLHSVPGHRRVPQQAPFGSDLAR